jgi:hypothetical protein
MRLVANLSDNRVEKVFQGVARMPQISSHVLNRIANVMSDIFEDSKEAPIVEERRSTRQSMRSTQPSSQPSSTRRFARSTRSKLKSKKPIEDSEPSEDNKETESKKTASSEEDANRSNVVRLVSKAKVTHFFEQLLTYGFLKS